MSDELASDLVVLSARLVRAVRREQAIPPGFRLLSLLDERGPLGITRLAELDRCSQPTMSATVAGLVTEGLVTKSPDPLDSRAAVVALTRAGRDRLTRVRRRSGADVSQRLAAHPDLDETDLARAVAVLRALVTPEDPAGDSAEREEALLS